MYQRVIENIKENIKFAEHNIGMIQHNMPPKIPTDALSSYEEIVVNSGFNLDSKEISNALDMARKKGLSQKYKYLWNLRNLSMWQGKKQISENYLATQYGEL